MSSLSESPLLALSNNLADAVERAGRSVVGIKGRRISASGIHWRPGIIVTSDESIRRSEDITVTLPDERTVSVTLAARDSTTDIAVFKLPDTDLPVAEIGEPSSLKVGHLVLALGRGENGVSASMGVISTVGSSWRSMSGGAIDQLIYPDITLYRSFGGGPLVDVTGRVLGFNTYGPRNRSLTIPATTVNRVVDQLLSKGHVGRGYIGLGVQPVRLPDTLKNALSLSANEGVIVVNVEPNGAAEKAGVLIGDVLVAINGTPVSNTSDVQAMLGPDSVGQTLTLQLVRGGALTELAIVPSEKSRRENAQ